MHSASLEKGLIVLVAGEPATVVECLADAKVELTRYKDKKKLIVHVDDVTLLPRDDPKIDGVVAQEDTDNISLQELKVAQERFELIEKYLKGEMSIERIAHLARLSCPRMYQLVKIYDVGVGPRSLLRRKRGRKLGINRLSQSVEEIITEVIIRRRTEQKFTFHELWLEIKEKCLAAGEKPPCIGAITARIKAMSAKKLHALRFGKDSADQHFGARPGKRTVNYPLEVAQMDHTLVDIILCDQETRKPIGRPWLTVIIDLYSRVIMGYYIGFNPPSTLSVACAITHAVFPKQTYLKNIGLNGELYPFYGLPKALHMDNAKEFRSSKLERACALYGIKTEYRPYGKKHYGGHVERLIGTLMTSNVHFLSGTTFSNTQQRKGYDSEKKATLSLREFVKWFAGQVMLYHGSIHRGIDCAPGDAWLKAFTSETGSVRNPALLYDPARFKIDFMPEERRAITPKGVSLFGKNYWSPAFVNYIGLKKVIVKYDPLSLSKIWLKLDGEYVVASYVDVTGEDISYEEYLVGRGKAKDVQWMKPDQFSAVYKKNDDLTKQSAAKTKQARKMQAAQKEYNHYLRSGGIHPSSSEKNISSSQENINYSVKPSSFASEDN